MKNLLIFVSILISSLCFSQNNDVKKEGLFGKVKSVSFANYDVKELDGQYLKGQKKQESFFDDYVVTDYNINGNRILETYKKTDNSIRKTIKYTYNEKNQVTEISTDKFGKEKFEYNEKSQLINHTSFDENGRIDNFITYSYDTLGNLLEEKFTNFTYKYFYNSNKLKIKLEKYDNDDISKGKIFKSKVEPTSFNEYKYDTENRISEKTEISKTRKDEESYLYDNFGNILVEIINIDKKNDGSSYSTIMRKYIYKYDENQNWISRILIVDNKPIAFDERIIEYY